MRELGHLNSPYIDDSLLVGDDWLECAQNVRDTVEMSLDCGFVVHPLKSIFIPTQIIEFLGFWINSQNMTVKLTERKALVIKEMCKDLISFKRPTIRTVAKVVGKLVSSFPGVRFGKLYYRLLDNEKSLALQKSKGNFEAKMKLSAESKKDLQWWVDNIMDTTCPIVETKPDITVFSDASKLGWGGAFGDNTTGGNWSLSESEIHINVLELMAALYVLASLCNNVENSHIRIMVDNKTAVSYINGMGGRKPTCNVVARKIWQWCLSKNNWLSAAYLTSKENVVADKMSRLVHSNAEWSLKDEIYQSITNYYDTPVIDLFASRLNHKCKRYVAWQPDPYAEAVDAFSLDWGTEKLIYIFPPFCLINKVLQKIDMDKANAIVIVPQWPTQPWWSKLTRMLTSCPLYFNRNQDTLTHPRRSLEDLPRMVLLACSLSGTHSMQVRYQKKHSRLYCQHGEALQPDNMRSTCAGGRSLQFGDIFIPMHPL